MSGSTEPVLEDCDHVGSSSWQCRPCKKLTGKLEGRFGQSCFEMAAWDCPSSKYHNTGEDIRRILMKYDEIQWQHNEYWYIRSMIQLQDVTTSSRIIETHRITNINPTKRWFFRSWEVQGIQMLLCQLRSDSLVYTKRIWIFVAALIKFYVHQQ